MKNSSQRDDVLWQKKSAEDKNSKPGVYQCVMCLYTEVSWQHLNSCPQCHRSMRRIS